MTSKQYHIGDVLSITTQRLVAPRGMEAIYDILNFMTGDSLHTHQLPRASRECAPWLLRRHPQLADCDTSALEKLTDDTSKEARHSLIEGWLRMQVAKYGKMLSVEPIPADYHERKDPLQELIEMRGGDHETFVVEL